RPVQTGISQTVFSKSSVDAYNKAVAQLSSVAQQQQKTVREQAQAAAEQPTDAQVAALLPVRRADAHKGTAGRVWIVGGHPGTVGAAGMAGVGALRAGAGLVTVHSAAGVPLLMPELMIHRHADLRAALLGTPEPGRPDALAVGMGLGPGAADLARELLRWQRPTVLDADALHGELAGHGHAACIWTPHPGEAARMLGTDVRDVTRDPLSAARALQQRLGGAVVLKGGPSVVAYPAGLSVSRGGHPGMASGGMGDTLSGILAALLGQGLSARDAAVTGVRLHARAGERAAQAHGYGLSASDVAQELGGAWQDLVRTAVDSVQSRINPSGREQEQQTDGAPFRPSRADRRM
uniref:NAD(P)H-hydrate dehydratase n=1 Tax=Deinococcus sp. TaxID=47478 RepID=UPI0025BDA06A